jgi:hypothetical protein
VELGVIGLAATLVGLLVVLAWLVADIHPADRLRARPWFLVLGGAIVVFALLVAVRTIQVGL